MQVIPTGAALAAEIRGVDLRHIDDSDFAAIHRAWLDHLVLLFRGQQLNDEDLIAFSRRFGGLDWAPVQENGRRFVDDHPEIYVVSNVIENGSPPRSCSPRTRLAVARGRAKRSPMLPSGPRAKTAVQAASHSSVKPSGEKPPV